MWLYRWNGAAWSYTYRYAQARASAGGIWLDAAGSMITSMQFSLQRNSGAYALLERVVGPGGGDGVVFWARYYLNYWGGGGYTDYCTS